MPGKITKNADGVTVLVATCDICGKVAHWGYANRWSCAEHRQEIEAQWVAESMNKTAGER